MSLYGPSYIDTPLTKLPLPPLIRMYTYAWLQQHREVYKTIPEMRIPPLITHPT